MRRGPGRRCGCRSFEGDDFFRVIGEDANVLEAEVDQDLRADAAFVLDHALARRLAIELAALVEMNLGSAPGSSAVSTLKPRPVWCK